MRLNYLLPSQKTKLINLILTRPRDLFFRTSILFFYCCNAFAFNDLDTKNSTAKLPSVLKADIIDGDVAKDRIKASGNVEMSNDGNTLFSDNAVYNKRTNIIKVKGHVRAKNGDIGNITATGGWSKDDFSQGEFYNGSLILKDGSYINSRKIRRENSNVTILKDAIYSICPNPTIALDNKEARGNRGMVSIKAKSTKIDDKNNSIKIRGGIVRIYNFPVFYTPYLRLPLLGKERKSGFLYPSYVTGNRLGAGISIPYYLNIAANKDLTTTTQIHPISGNLIVDNKFRHLLKSGDYDIDLKLANNKVTSSNDTTIVSRTNDSVRWLLKSSGEFNFKNNYGLDFDINNVGDADYYRDYQNDYAGYTTSKISFDQIKDKNYNSIKTIRFQELERAGEQSPQMILPVIDSYLETKPVFFKEKLSLTSNFTSIHRESGLQYNRTSFKPEIKLPFNLNGNLFEAKSSVASNLYYLEDNFKYDEPSAIKYKSFESSTNSEVAIDWKLPLIRKANSQTIIIEPQANFIYSSSDSSNTPNEDSNNGELTTSNLFSSNRIAGFDRFESGKRFNYGVKSLLTNKYGQYGMFLGQGIRDKNRDDIVPINGFTDTGKSNVIGNIEYTAKKHFNVRYSFQLDQSNYRNDINQLSANLDLTRIKFSTDYILLRKTLQSSEKQQVNFSTEVKINDKWNVNFANTKDLTDDRNILRRAGLNYGGCCAVFSFVVSENNPSNFIKSERSFNINFSLKNL